MGPPGGGRNDISGRFTRHMNIISIDSFDDNTMTKIFTSIVDWHFAKGFDASFARLGKVRMKSLISKETAVPRCWEKKARKFCVKGDKGEITTVRRLRGRRFKR